MLLFYSKKCPNSLKLLREYNLNGFRLVNVDCEKFPPQVTMVPCIMNPRGQILFGKPLFDTVASNDNVEPFQFSHNNNMNTGFSFLDSENDYYTEPECYTSF